MTIISKVAWKCIWCCHRVQRYVTASHSDLPMTENPFICHMMNLLWLLSEKGTRVRFCWIPSHCDIEGNERVDQLANETFDHDIDPLASVQYADLNPLVNSCTQQLVQIKWEVAAHDRDPYLLKPTLGTPKKFQHLIWEAELAIARLRMGHTEATKAHILFRGRTTTCHHCDQMLTIDHMLLDYAVIQGSRDVRIISCTCKLEFRWAAEFFLYDLNHQTFYTIPYLNHLRTNAMFLTSTSPQPWIMYNQARLICWGSERIYERHPPV